MDHLPYPQHPAAPPKDVPYLCTTPYDCGDFQSFPQRAGWQSTLDCWQQLLPGTCKHERCAIRLPELEPFVQQWLFFGLLHYFLDNEYREADFVIEVRPGAKVVRTGFLIAKLDKCIRLEWTADERKHRLLQWRHDLDKVSRVVQRLFVPAKLLHQKRGNIGDTSEERTGGVIRNWIVWQSILCLGETLTFFVHSLYGDDIGLETRWRALYIGMDEVLGGNDYATAMRRHGWCVSRASRLCQQSSTLTKLHFFSGLRSPDSADMHSNCTPAMCIRSQIDVKTYKPAECPGCNCAMVGYGDDHREIAAILDREALPVLRIEGQSAQDVTIRLEEASEEKPYVALSHVWADGLGNPGAMRIHGCQLLRLRDMIAQLKGTEIFKDEAIASDELLLWCDTLCVPPYKEQMSSDYERARDLAMQRMRNVYRRAAYMLVLDASLTPFSLGDIGPLEAALRLIHSPWMERLWTMQEVLLAKKPLLIFKDRAVDLRCLWQQAKDTCVKSWLLHSMNVEVDYQIRRLRALVSDDLTTAQRTVQICSMVAQRRVTFPSDEAICLSNVLDLDISALFEAPKEDRMQKFWDLLGAVPNSIPSNIVMLDFRRLKSPGCRWAPESLLASSSTSSSHSAGAQIMTAFDKPEWSTQILADQGLAVRFAGWRVARAEQTLLVQAREAVWCDEHLRACFSSSMFVRDQDGLWYRMTTGSGVFVNNVLPSLDALPPSFTILRDPTGGDEPDFRALHVKPEGQYEDVQVVEPLTYLLLRKEAENEQLLWTAAYSKANALVDAGILPSSLRFVASLRPENANDPVLSASQTAEGRWWFELDVDGYVDLTQQHSRTAVPVYDFAMRVLTLFAGRYFIVEESYARDTVWCIR